MSGVPSYSERLVTVTHSFAYADQDLNGFGWEIGAFVYEEAASPNPFLTEVTIADDGETVTLVFNETVVTTDYDYGDLDLDCVLTRDNILLYDISGSGSTRTVTAESVILEDDTCNIDYTGDAGEITDNAEPPNSMETCDSCVTVT
ncbi:unnamed protein product, partial [marine sediment metagenome]